jgi:hypothetical protein
MCSDRYVDSFSADDFGSDFYSMANAVAGVTASVHGRYLACSNLSLAEWRALGFDTGPGPSGAFKRRPSRCPQ